MREAPCVSKGSEEFVLPTVPGCVPAKTAAAFGVSATARGELAQPGGDGLLVTQRLAAPGGARLAGADGVGLGRAAGPREPGGSRRCGCGRLPGRLVRVISERHRAENYKTIGGLSTPDG